ncbi:MAG: hypothetical protein WC215_02795 [Bacilli bacterium]|jgi:hypothetical protein
MGKYDSIETLLKRKGTSYPTIAFEEIENVIRGDLPSSAHIHQAWWYGSADCSPTHVQKRAWEKAGFTVDSVDLENRKATFKKL